MARKRQLSTREQLQYFFTGITGLGTRLMPEDKMDASATAAAEAAKRDALALIQARETVVVQLRALLPVPADDKEGDYHARKILASPSVLQSKRERLVMLLSLVRVSGAAIVAAVAAWRSAVRRSSAHYRHLPDEEMPLCSPFHGGASYLPRMCNDLSFLPLPTALDPLLVEWFGEQLPWMLDNVPKLGRLPCADETRRFAADVEATAQSSQVTGLQADVLPYLLTDSLTGRHTHSLTHSLSIARSLTGDGPPGRRHQPCLLRLQALVSPHGARGS